MVLVPDRVWPAPSHHRIKSMTSKCPGCGLVNYVDADVCRRCGVALEAAPYQQWNAPSYGASHAPYADEGYAPAAFAGQTPYNWPAAAFTPTALELAGRVHRLGAAILDTLVALVPIFFAGLLGVAIGSRGAIIAAICLGILGFLGVIVLQVTMLTKEGQTVGKRALGVRIVHLETGAVGGFVPNVVMRILVPSVISWIPYLGFVFSIVDLLFIFREDRRCLHDLIAGTVVVVAR
jgi:uncharacterized RDD family membrane protein YckC